jgi:hypothetical protein
MKNATFDISKKILGPVHLLTKTDKWDYLLCPIIEKKIVSCFDIGEVPRSPGKWNWNRLSFLPFIFSFEQCEYSKALGCTVFGEWKNLCSSKIVQLELLNKAKARTSKNRAA